MVANDSSVLSPVTHLEYCVQVWAPHFRRDMSKLKGDQDGKPENKLSLGKRRQWWGIWLLFSLKVSPMVAEGTAGSVLRKDRLRLDVKITFLTIKRYTKIKQPVLEIGYLSLELFKQRLTDCLLCHRGNSCGSMGWIRWSPRSLWFQILWWGGQRRSGEKISGKQSLVKMEWLLVPFWQSWAHWGW